MTPDGVIIINKDAGMTSQTVVSRVKRLLDVSTAGHTGTLDPMATGVLPVLVGRGVKLSEYLTADDKHYVTVLRLGYTTDTEDVTGTVLSESDAIPEESTVLAVARGFIGEQTQIPPMYSALKKNGQKLVDLARRGITVEREPRCITVKSLSVARIDDRNYTLDVQCTKGTYIRTLCADIGKALGCGGVMAALTRVEAAGFSCDGAVTLSELEAMSANEREHRVIPVENLLSAYSAVFLPPFFSRLARSGCEIYLRKIGVTAAIGDRCRLYDENLRFFALAEVRGYPDGDALKPIKQF